MRYEFGDYSLDVDKFELRQAGELVAIEPQAFALLKLLIENRDRLVPKDEIVTEVWHGRAISDASIANRIKLARSALGDNGNAQHSIRTIHGQGYRFVADISNGGPAPRTSIGERAHAPDAALEDQMRGTKPSLAVLPFQFLGAPSPSSILAEAIPHDLIQALSRLRWLFVIARGSTFRFRSGSDQPEDIGKALGVRYVLAGSVENHGRELVVTTELSDAHTGGVLWGERFSATPDDVHQIRMEIIGSVVSSLEVYIPLNEALGAQLNVSENMDAWSNYHLGIQHMYRFTKEDNESASAFFTQAIGQDRSFSRAHAGLSFTSFQKAFLRYGGGQQDAMTDACRFAERSIELDPLDPFANLTMGRALMLRGDLEASVSWLDKSITLSPNYSQGFYSYAFSNMLAGKTAASLDHYDTALTLSPLDPLAYAMLAGRCLSFAINGDFESAAQAGEKAAKAPGAHYIVEMIALIGHSLNDDKEHAQAWAEKIRAQRPDASQTLFFESFPFSNDNIKQRLSGALAQYGF